MYLRRAKEKRERLRHAHLAPDYIPLHSITRTTGKTKGGSSKPGAEAGGGGDTMEPSKGAEGSESDEEPEEMMRLKFTAETQR